MIKIKNYYCKKCIRYYYYQEHRRYKRKKKTHYNEYSNFEINLNKFIPIAKRQLNGLVKKACISGNHDLFKNEIIKLLIAEEGT